MHRKAAYAALLLGFICALVAGCDGAWGQYITYVDNVEPPVPGLIVTGTTVIGGEIVITNETGLDVYIYERGREVLKITPTEYFRKYNGWGWSRPRPGNKVPYFSGDVVYWGSSQGAPAGEHPGQVVKTWVIAGRAGDTPFQIYGRTVYEPVE